MSIKQIVNPARLWTFAYVVLLILITSLSVYGYISIDKVPEDQQKLSELYKIQRLLLSITLLSLGIGCAFIVQKFLTTKDTDTEDPLHHANNDYLTNLLNRRSFNLLAQQAVALSKRYNSELSVVSLDIDHFKSINQEYGQILGDKVIQSVAATIEQNCRDSDSVFRFDGEAFLLLLPQTSEQHALKLADKIRLKIANAPIFCEQLIIEMTVSGGVAQWQNQEADIEKALNRADKALEKAKTQGRDRVLIAKQIPYVRPQGSTISKP